MINNHLVMIEAFSIDFLERVFWQYSLSYEAIVYSKGKDFVTHVSNYIVKVEELKYIWCNDFLGNEIIIYLCSPVTKSMS